jgi:two-component system chemotaxis response regulator CheB
MESPTTIIVIGASAGGVEAIRTVVSALPANLDAAVFVTLHIGAHRSDLPALLTRAGSLPAKHPKDREPIIRGRIYVSPPDHHMLVEADGVRLSKGPRENWARPAVDPMFRSAAQAFGPAVIGVILTGGLNDGTAGLIEIKANGGTAIIQDPNDAYNPSMPESALEHVDVDHILVAAEIGRSLAKMAAVRHDGRVGQDDTPVVSRAPEIDMEAQFILDHPVAVTCPDCGGALRQSQLGPLTQFSCHIGHVYTMEVVLAAQFLALERFLEQAMRSLSERAELCRMMASKLPQLETNSAERELWISARQEAFDQTQPLRQILTREWIHPARDRVTEATSGQ